MATPTGIWLPVSVGNENIDDIRFDIRGQNVLMLGEFDIHYFVQLPLHVDLPEQRDELVANEMLLHEIAVHVHAGKPGHDTALVFCHRSSMCERHILEAERSPPPPPPPPSRGVKVIPNPRTADSQILLADLS